MENTEYDFLDANEKHTLTEAECELISFYRFLNEEQRKMLFKVAFTMALNDERVAPKNS